MHRKSNTGHEIAKCPHSSYGPENRSIADFRLMSREKIRVNGDSQNEKTATNIARMEQPALQRASGGRREYGSSAKPVETDCQCKALLQIGQEQVENEQNALCPGWKARVV